MCVIKRKMLSDVGKFFGGLCAFLWLFTAIVEAQTVTMKGSVSETVSLSVPSNLAQGEAHVNVLSSGNTVRMTVTGTGDVIRVPLMVRSNTNFKISCVFESKLAQLTQLSVIDARATGRLVSSEAVNNLELPAQSDLQGSNGPFAVLSGPRVSIGGTLNSPTNALQITILLRIKPESSGDWLVNLTFLNH